MHEPAPILPDPESERRGHELRDVAIRPIFYFLIGLFVFGGVVQAAMSLLMTGYIAQDTKIAVPKTPGEFLHDTGDLSHPAPLQSNTTADMLKMYDDDDKVLHAEKPVFDKKTGKYYLPIDRAMQIVAKKGLPHRDAAAKKAIDPEPLPYPMKSEPYKATP